MSYAVIVRKFRFNGKKLFWNQVQLLIINLITLIITTVAGKCTVNENIRR